MRADLLALLIVGHFIGDFLLQTRWMALQKENYFLPLLVHTMVYTLSLFTVALFAAPLNTLQTMLIIMSHAAIDKSGFVTWWVRTVNGSPQEEWLKMVVDQSWHLVVLMLVAYLG